jgi:hypothetical protein
MVEVERDMERVAAKKKVAMAVWTGREGERDWVEVVKVAKVVAKVAGAMAAVETEAAAEVKIARLAAVASKPTIMPSTRHLCHVP